LSPTFPALAFCREVGRYAKPGGVTLEWFGGWESFSTCISWDLKHGQRHGMVVVGSDLCVWEVREVVDLGVVGPIWERVLRFLVQQSVHRIDQRLIELEPMSLEQLKARVAAAVPGDPAVWWDDDVIAGVDGPPREEQELLDEVLARVQAARSIPQIINALWNEELEG
jgi:hypothetical protein